MAKESIHTTGILQTTMYLTFSSSEDDGTNIQVQKQNEFCNLILNVSAEITDLYSSMDAYTSQEVTISYVILNIF
jgi:hypothetical protein